VPATPASRDAAEDADRGFAAPGVDRRELRKLRRGDHTPASRLDLHGMTGAEAVERVKRFIDSRRHGERCVCIIHGRGLHSETRIPVLKSRVRECLRAHRAVLAFTDAPPADGGTGAVYVLLRK
jgi:DNA-nicking Smr family endonuclease